MDLIEFTIDKLKQLELKTEFEDRQRGKVRYVSKRSIYKDLIKLLEEIYEKEN